jgi:hypothetical protein
MFQRIRVDRLRSSRTDTTQHSQYGTELHRCRLILGTTQPCHGVWADPPPDADVHVGEIGHEQLLGQLPVALFPLPTVTPP